MTRTVICSAAAEAALLRERAEHRMVVARPLETVMKGIMNLVEADLVLEGPALED